MKVESPSLACTTFNVLGTILECRSSIGYSGYSDGEFAGNFSPPLFLGKCLRQNLEGDHESCCGMIEKQIVR
jgi:hypothetical protein